MRASDEQKAGWREVHEIFHDWVGPYPSMSSLTYVEVSRRTFYSGVMRVANRITSWNAQSPLNQRGISANPP
jgi:hypothetical protein